MKNWLYGFLLMGMLASCNLVSDLKDLEPVKYEAEFAVPLINSDITFGEILKELENVASIYVDSTGLLHFRYNGDLLTRTSDEIFGNLLKSLPPVIPVLTNNFPLPFAIPDGVDLDRVDMKAGTLGYYFENTSSSAIQVTVTIPQLLKGGQPFRFQVNLPGYSGSGARPSASNLAAPADLAGYSFVPQDDFVYIQYQARTTGGQAVQLQNFTLRLNNLAFSYVEGYLGKLLYEGENDVVKIDFIEDHYTRGNITFVDPTVTFFLENSFGIPTRAIVNSFNVVTATGKTLAVESPFVTSGIDFPYPALNQVGQSRKTAFVFNKTNSNVDKLLSSDPVSVAYDVDALTHPDGNRNVKGFVTDKSFYKVQVEVDLPLYGRANNFEVAEDFNVNLDDFKEVQKVQFKVVTENEIPLDLVVQAYFQDATGQTIDSVLAGPQRIVEGAKVGNDGIATGNVVKTTFVEFEGQRLDRILPAQKMLVRAIFSTQNNPGKDVKVLDNQVFQFKLGAIIGVKLE